jgi:predicted membrane protein
VTNKEVNKCVTIAYVSFAVLAMLIVIIVYVNPFQYSDKTNILTAAIAIIIVVGANVLNLLKKAIGEK